MKVGELKKMNEYAIDKRITLDWDCLLKYNQDDIAKILELINYDNAKVEQVINFIDWELKNPDWKNDYQHLEGIEKFDIREYLMERISTAFSVLGSEMVCRYFDFYGQLELFHTVEEWKTYIECVNDGMAQRPCTVILNTQKVLEKATNNRCNLIKMVMEYSQRGSLDTYEISEYISEESLENHLESILSLLLKGYHIESVRELFDHLDRDVKDVEDSDQLAEILKSYRTAINYLKNSKFFNPIKDDHGLIDIFSNYYFDNYDDIINLLKEIEDKEDKELFELCLENPFQLDNSDIRDYLRIILSKKNSNDDCRSALIYLWKNRVIADEGFYLSTDNICLVYNALDHTNRMDNISMDMAKFIESIHYVEMIKGMVITDANLATRELLYEEFPKFIEGMSMSENQVNHYRDWLEKLSSLPFDVCEKVMAIVNIPIIKNMDMEKQNEIKEIVLNPENFGSLDYIYTKYEEKEEEYNKYHRAENPPVEATPKKVSSYNPEVKLTTVLELLRSGNNPVEVLVDFQEDEEITPKTLIRSCKHLKK